MQRPAPQLSLAAVMDTASWNIMKVGLGISRYGDLPNSADLLDRDIGDMDRHTSTHFTIPQMVEG